MWGGVLHEDEYRGSVWNSAMVLSYSFALFWMQNGGIGCVGQCHQVSRGAEPLKRVRWWKDCFNTSPPIILSCSFTSFLMLGGASVSCSFALFRMSCAQRHPICGAGPDIFSLGSPPLGVKNIEQRESCGGVLEQRDVVRLLLCDTIAQGLFARASSISLSSRLM